MTPRRLPASPASNGRRVDLDAARKARQEQGKDAPVVILGGEEFTLPPGISALVVIGLARARRGDPDGFVDAIEGLFGDRTKDILALGLEVEDIDMIAEQAYGEDPGESPASGE